MKRVFVRLDAPSGEGRRRLVRAARRVLGGLAAPAYCALAAMRGAPGVAVHACAAALGAKAAARARTRADLRRAYDLAVFPMDSVRYFELAFVMRSLRGRRIGRYLDVSSPRLLPALVLSGHRRGRADLVNPDARDLEATSRLLSQLGLLPRCRLHAAGIEQAPLPGGSFDTITSVSVIEHIPDERGAVERLRDVARPGARIILTVPCAAEAFEEMIDRDEYGLLTPDPSGFFLGQRFYDAAALRTRVFAILGRPRRMAIYGERTPGLFFENRRGKQVPDGYPFWKEPYLFASAFRPFASLEALPGIGVVAMEFAKPA